MKRVAVGATFLTEPKTLVLMVTDAVRYYTWI